MIKTLAKNIKGFVKESVLTPFFMILEVIVETIIPFLMSSMIDDGINKGDMQHIFITGGYMGALALTGLFAGMMGGIYGAKASAGFARNLRRSMFANIQSFSFANIDRYDNGCNKSSKCISDAFKNVFQSACIAHLCNGNDIHHQCKACLYLSHCNNFTFCCSCLYYEGNIQVFQSGF